MARLSTDRIAVFQFIYPATAIVIDWLFYEQRLGNVQLSGIALMAVAVWFAERVPKQHRVVPLMPGNTALEPVGNPFKPKQDRITIGRYQSTPDVPRTASSVECLLLAGSGRMPGRIALVAPIMGDFAEPRPQISSTSRSPISKA